MSETIRHNEEKPVESGREILWEQKRKKTDEIKDGLGHGVDEDIKRAVTALIIYGFSTDASCGGHLEAEEHGELYPWVEIYASEPKGLEKSKGEAKEKKEQKWRIENLRQQKKMISYLEDFYQGRETAFDARLVFENVGIFGGFRIKSLGGQVMELLSPEEQQAKLELYRQEMDDFSQFLKEKFLNNN